MKITNYVIIFMVIFLVAIFGIDKRVSNYTVLSNKKAQYNRNLDRAVDDALEHLVETDDGAVLKLNKEDCVDNFYRSLNASFGALDSPSMQEMLKLYTPVIALTVEDGYYIHYLDLVDGKAIPKWTPKKPYMWKTSNYVVNFTFGTDVTVYITGGSRAYHGDYRDLKELYPAIDPNTGATNTEHTKLANMLEHSALAKADTFDEQRRNSIISCLMKDMTYYMNQHNDVASGYGFQYVFRLPESAMDSAARTVDDISLLVIFQGYPYGTGINDTYNKIAVGGARLMKDNHYKLMKDENGIVYYHKNSCGLAFDSDYSLFTRLECVREGALPCPYCKP